MNFDGKRFEKILIKNLSEMELYFKSLKEMPL